MESEDKKIITVSNQIHVGPTLAVGLICYFVLTGELSWWVLLIVSLWSLGDSIVIDWRKLFRRRS
ncbi:hypothetical protein ACEUAI_13200 [Aeromonas veronii]